MLSGLVWALKCPSCAVRYACYQPGQCDRGPQKAAWGKVLLADNSLWSVLLRCDTTAPWLLLVCKLSQHGGGKKPFLLRAYKPQSILHTDSALYMNEVLNWKRMTLGLTPCCDELLRINAFSFILKRFFSPYFIACNEVQWKWSNHTQHQQQKLHLSFGADMYQVMCYVGVKLDQWNCLVIDLNSFYCAPVGTTQSLSFRTMIKEIDCHGDIKNNSLKCAADAGLDNGEELQCDLKRVSEWTLSGGSPPGALQWRGTIHKTTH